LKILHIISGLDTGGAERMLLKLIETMDKTRYHSCVVSLREKALIGEKIKNEGVKVYSLNIQGILSSPKALWDLIHILYKEKPDIIQGWMYHGNISAYIASLFYKYNHRVIWNIRHSIHVGGREKRLTRFVIYFCAKLSGKVSVILYNSYVSSKQHAKIGYTTVNSKIIANGFDCDKFKPDELARKKLRNSLGIADSEVLIGHAARNHPMKDHFTFLYAASILAKKIKNVRFILVGKEIDNQNKFLVNHLKNKELFGKVLMMGEFSKMPEFFASLDIFCLSSAWGEGFPNVLGEAMACSVPCVSTNVGDSRFVVGETGFIVEKNKPEEIADAIEYLIRLNNDKRNQLGQKARQRVLDNFRLIKIAEKYETTYEHLFD